MEWRVEENDAPPGERALAFQFLETADDEKLRLHAARRSADAVAQAQHRDFRMSRLDDLGALAAAHPVRNHHPFGMHVFETVALHFLGGPADRRIQLRRSTEAMAEKVGHQRQALPRCVIGGGSGNQAVGGLAIVADPVRGSLRAQIGCARDEGH